MTRKQLIVLGSVGLGVLAIVVLVLTQLGSSELGSRGYYYIESSGKLFADEADRPVPFDGPGGEAVGAVVYTCGGDCGSAADRQIAYLYKYTDEYSELLEQAKEAMRRGEAPPAELADQSLRGRSTLVRLPEDDGWVPLVSERGDWLDGVLLRRCENGAMPFRCDPSD